MSKYNRPRVSSRALAAAAAVLSAAFLAAYLPDVGHGFVKDDFAWIRHARMTDPGALARLLFGTLGFYRPVVSITFGVNEWMFGNSALGYGLTNLALAAACAAAVGALARALALPAGAALMAAGLWAFNFHGINMAVLWISGRTALCLTLFAVLAAHAAVRGRPALVFLFSLLAALSKEEAVLLPMVCGVMAVRPGEPGGLRPRVIWRQAWPAVWPSLAAVLIYLALRAQSGAMTPATAPAFYQPAFSPSTVIVNLLQYADRSSTLAAAAVLVMAAVTRRWPSPDPRIMGVVLKGAIWIVLAFGVTVWLPVRSSLYAVWPSVGAALAAAALAGALWPRGSDRQRRALVAAALLLPFLLWPVYRSRNVRWVELADLTRDTIRAVGGAAVPDGSLVVLQDDRSTRASFNNAFGTLYPDAVTLFFEDRFAVWIDSVEEMGERPAKAAAATFALRDGQIARIE